MFNDVSLVFLLLILNTFRLFIDNLENIVGLCKCLAFMDIVDRWMDKKRFKFRSSTCHSSEQFTQSINLL